MSRFFAYLYTQRRVFFLWAVTAALLIMITYLYRLPLEPFGYAAVLSGAAGLLLLGTGYPAYARRCRDAELAAEDPGASPDLAPPEGGPAGLEGAYQQSLQALSAACDEAHRTARDQRDDMLDYFTMWAHQVKTSLAAMRLLLQGEDLPPRSELEGELFQTERYVGMVLGYLRLGSDSNDLVLSPTALDPVIRAGARRFARMFILKKLSFRYEGTSARPVTDGKWVGFILEQLLSNAVKYTPSGGCVTVTADDRRLAVSDTGVGIRPEDLPRIFEKGYTGCNGRAEASSSGLGLYLCAQAAKKLGCTIHAASTPEEGTRVELLFPPEPPLYE